MTPENFIYWLQGKLEIGDTKSLNEQEVQVIKDHIALVLKKETPNRIGPIVIKEDSTLKNDEIIFRPPSIPRQPSIFDNPDILKPRCQGGMGSCSKLSCRVCSSSLPLIC